MKKYKKQLPPIILAILFVGAIVSIFFVTKVPTTNVPPPANIPAGQPVQLTIEQLSFMIKNAEKDNVPFAIVAAVISGVAASFFFELLMDWFFRPRRAFLDFRGRVFFSISFYEEAFRTPEAVKNASSPDIVDKLHGIHLKAYKGFDILLNQANQLKASQAKFAPGLPSQKEWDDIIENLESLQKRIVISDEKANAIKKDDREKLKVLSMINDNIFNLSSALGLKKIKISSLYQNEVKRIIEKRDTLLQDINKYLADRERGLLGFVEGNIPELQNRIIANSNNQVTDNNLYNFEAFDEEVKSLKVETQKEIEELSKELNEKNGQSL
jgi:hypothetical protein